jgi:hypothetical protein
MRHWYIAISQVITGTNKPLKPYPHIAMPVANPILRSNQFAMAVMITVLLQALMPMASRVNAV